MTAPDTELDKSDPGDDIAARFDFQHCYAAINAIRLITDEAKVTEVICENHEDFIVKVPTGQFAGIQIKTRSHTMPPFKANDAQVTKGLIRFCKLDGKFPGAFESFDFTTNHFFWEEEDSKNNLPWLLKTLRERGGIKGLPGKNSLRQFVEEIATESGLKATEIAATLLKTTARGHHMAVGHIRGLVRDALAECPGVNELPLSTVAQIANAIIDLARAASTKAMRGSITDLFAPGTILAQVIDDQVLAGKKICKADVQAVIDTVRANSTSYQDIDLTNLITPADVPANLVRAIRKLARGGVESGRVTNIEDRIRSFEYLYIEWSRKHGAEEALKRYNNVLAAVQHETAEAQAKAEKTGEPYGSEMYSVLADRLRARAKTDADQLYMCRPEHLMGAAGMLTQKCKAWWSSPFDVDGEPE